MKNRINTTCFREIKSSFKRFLSLLIMSMLGVGVFVGISMAAPCMMKSVDKYYDDANYYDVKLISTLGFTSDTINEISKLDSVSEVYMTTSKDVLMKAGKQEPVVKLIALNDDVNKIEITSGRKPKENDEIVIEEAMLDRNNLKIGDFVSIVDDDGFKETKLRIVGTVKSPLYINSATSSSDRGNTSLGTGKINYYAYINEDNFNLDYYTEVYVTVKGAKDEVTNSKDYKELINNAIKEIESIKEDCQDARYDEIYTALNNEITKNENEGLDKLNSAKKELDIAKLTLDNGKEELDNTKVLLDNASSELSSNKASLDTFKVELSNTNEELINAKNQIDSGINEINNKLKPYNITYDDILSLDSTLYNEEVTKPIIIGLIPTNLPNYDDAISGINEVYALGLDDKIIDFVKGDLTKDELINSIPADSNNHDLMVNAVNLLSYLLENDYFSDPNNIDTIINLIPSDTPNYEKIVGVLKLYRDNINDIDNLYSGINKIEEAKKEYASGLALYNEMQNKYNDAYNLYVNYYNEYQNGLAYYNNGLLSYNSNLNLYNSSLQEYYNSRALFENEISDAKEELVNLPKCTWYVYDRLDDSVYQEFINDSNSIANLSKVFPTIFFVVAILISLISMSRMVEDDRGEIGTLKSLGFSNRHIRKKYILYAFLACFIGCIIGSILGFFLLPMYIWNIYKIIFDIPVFSLDYNPIYVIAGCLIAIICICGTTLLTIRKVVKEKPSELMRPKAPANGKRVLLEKVPFIWKRLKFSNKVIVRNIFRDKRRVIMTIVGILGCTGLILTGFGIRDSIVDIPTYQYENVFNFDNMVYLNEGVTDEQINMLFNNNHIKSTLNTNITTGTSNGYSVNILTTQDELNGILSLNDVKTKEKLELEDNKVVISDKLADLTNTKVNDKITFEDANGISYEFTVSDICENYVGHYVFMNKKTYENNIGNYSTNVVFVKATDDKYEEEISRKLLDSEEVMTVISTESTIRTVDDMLKSLDSVVVILIILSACLSFVVLYNLSYINISERKREIATLKVLGFTNKEVDNYINKETIILTIIGIAFGLVFGIFLTNIIINTVEIEMVRFIRHINVLSFVGSALITIVFTLVVNLITHYSLKKIDMIESLKSVE